MILADVFGQAQVMQLARPAGGDGLPWLQRQDGHSYHGDTCYVEERRETIEKKKKKKKNLWRADPPRPTSGSPEPTLVWIRILPTRTSLHTALRAGSIVSPARSTDTPVICGDERAGAVSGRRKTRWKRKLGSPLSRRSGGLRTRDPAASGPGTSDGGNGVSEAAEERRSLLRRGRASPGRAGRSELARSGAASASWSRR